MKYIISLQSDRKGTYYFKSLSQDIVKFLENADVTRLHMVIKQNTQVKNS